MRPYVVVVDHVPPEGETFEVTIGADAVAERLGEAPSAGFAPLGDVVASARVLPSGGDVFVLGRLRGRVRGECSRCLDAFEESVDAEFHLTFVRDLPAAEGGEKELHREDLEVEVLTGGAVDLGEVVTEQFQLALPSRPICRDECRGLCPQCGVNRNRESCECQSRAVDPRFAALAALRRSGGEPEE